MSWATPETLAIMALRYGTSEGTPVAYGESVQLGGVDISYVPAGHVLGSAQILLEHAGERVVVTGDYKRRDDPTCAPFEVAPCDIFITEATFGLPVFRHPAIGQEMDRLLGALHAAPERCVLVGAYALGKAQRVIAELRRRGHDDPIYYHGAMERLCRLYEELGVPLGELRPATGASKDELRAHGHRDPIYIHGALERMCDLYRDFGIDLGELYPATTASADQLRGKIVVAPPSALNDRWSRRLPDPITAMASGWMRVRQRARQKNVELPLVISDHADWDELTATIREVAPSEIWVTHGREEALVHWCGMHQMRARALALVGYEDEDEG